MRKRVVHLDKMDDPYMSFVEMMRNQGSSGNQVPFLLGKVISASPLLIQAGNIQLEREDLLINEALISGYTRKVEVRPDISDSYNADIETKDDFKINDQVILLMSPDQQQFILLCKVR